MNPSDAEFHESSEHSHRDGERRRLLELTLATAALMWLSPSASALSMADLSDKDADSGLKAALDRLQSTTIATSIRQPTERRLHRFSWINEWKERADGNGRPRPS